MDSDVKINNSSESFKFRVNGILMHNDEVLVVKMENNSFYCLPGGHVKLGEDTKSAVIREIKEETGYDSQINKLVAITENFFVRSNGKKVHELSFYYLLNINDKEIINDKEYEIIDEEIKHHFKWTQLNELKNIDFKPQELKEKISNKNMEFQHFIIK